MSSRFETYAELEAQLRAMDDNALVQLLLCADAKPGLGCARVVDLDGARVFTKSLPLTRQEYVRAYSTENLFRLPSFYHYGVGSAGFGAFRELAAHTKTTRWVLSGEIDTFPLLYHHRILPIAGDSLNMSAHELDEYVTYWESSEAIRAYMLARQRAEHQVVMFLEYVPDVLAGWLNANLDHLDMVTCGMQRTIEFLRARGMGHFDAHVGNILTDGRQVFLTDFGLIIDEEFALDAEERVFLDLHRHYDAGEFVRGLYRPVRQLINDWDDATRHDVCERCGDTTPATILDNLEALVDAGALRLPAAYRGTLLRYRDAIAMMDRVFTGLHRGSKLHSRYDDDELRRALSQAGWRFLEPRGGG